MHDEKLATEMFVSIDTAKNRPELHKKVHMRWDRTHGTRVEADLEGQQRQPPGWRCAPTGLRTTRGHHGGGA